ncbi:MAG: alpha/beta hydrolase-fold protein [Pseudomonadota bacterium]
MKKLFLSVFSIYIGATAFAEELTPVTYPLSELQTIHSNANNKDYDLLIQLPNSYKESSISYPLIIVNDARFSFPITSGAMQLMGDRVVREAIVVGISYAKGEDMGVSRTRDYTPTYSPKESSAHSDEARAASGHAKEYSQFIEQQVIPELKRKYRIDNMNKIFVGHSFGGLLGSYILVTKPDLFNHYIIGSPSLWYDQKVILNMEEKYSKSHNRMNANVMIYVDADATGINSMVKDVRLFEKQLSSHKYTGLSVYVEVIKNENHHSVFPALLSKGLMKVIPIKK